MPTEADLRGGLQVDIDDELVTEARWMLERFTQTYLRGWSSASRSREWRFLRAHHPGCCPPGLMRQRVIDAQDLAKALADEHCAQEDESSDGQSWTANHFKSTAIAKLHAGLTEEAANVFRVLSDLDPGDAEARNNLGFCLMPTSPKDAVTYLRESLEKGSPTPTLTQFNLGLTFHLIGENSEALQIVLSALAEGEPSSDTNYVWVPSDGILEFHPTDDLLGYGEFLVQHMSECEGSCVLQNLVG